MAQLDSLLIAEVHRSPESPRTHERNLQVRNELLRLIYIACLVNLTPEETRKFWARHSLVINSRALTEKEKFSYLWEDLHCPLEFLLDVAEAFETLLREKGLPAAEFVRDRVFAPTSGAMLTPQAVLSFVGPVLRKAFSYVDIREFVTELIDKAAGQLVPGSTHRVLGKSCDGDRITYHLMHSLGQRRKASFNAHLWLRQLIASFPSALSSTDYDEVDVLSEQRGAEEVLVKYRHVGGRIEGSEFVFGNRTLGTVVRFRDFLAAHGIDLDDHDVANPLVVVLREDLKDQRTGEILLHKGCAYGAPIYISRVRFTRTPCLHGNPFQPHIDALIRPERTPVNEARRLHEEFMQTLTGSYAFVYKRKPQALCVNGRQIASRAPARILSVLLEEYVTRGREQFDLKSLRAHPGVNDDFTRDPGLNIRLIRITEILRKKAPLVTLTRRKGEGIVVLQPQCEVALSIEES